MDNKSKILHPGLPSAFPLEASKEGHSQVILQKVKRKEDKN